MGQPVRIHLLPLSQFRDYEVSVALLRAGLLGSWSTHAPVVSSPDPAKPGASGESSAGTALHNMERGRENAGGAWTTNLLQKGVMNAFHSDGAKSRIVTPNPKAGKLSRFNSTKGLLKVAGGTTRAAHRNFLFIAMLIIASVFPLTALCSSVTTATPVASVASGTYASAQKITLTDSTPNAVIYYTVNGSGPTTSSPVYSGPITLSSNSYIMARAQAPGDNMSSELNDHYYFLASPPVISPVAGTYTGAQTITLKSTTPGAGFFYTTDGSTPTTSSNWYGGPITVSSSTKIRAITWSSNYNTSNISSSAYTINLPATPVYSPAAGGYHAVQTVTISDATSGATIYYTTNGSAPTTQSTRYTGPITVSASTSFQAAALPKGGSALGPVAKSWYTITLTAATPVVSPAPGTYNTVQPVTLTTSTPNATIYYTLDGTYPTTSSPVYSGPIKATMNTTITALANAPSFNASAAVKGSYTIVAPPPSISPGSGLFTDTTKVTMSDAVSGAVIHYTNDGSTPTAASPTYTGPITVSPQRTTTEVFQAIAVASGYLQSSSTMATFTVDLPAGVLAQATVNLTPKLTVPPNFMGLSMYWNFPSGILGKASTGANLPYRKLLNNLTQYYTAPMLIRVLGDDSQTTNIQADVEPLVELAQAVDVNYILGVDLWNNDLSIADAEASTWMNGIPNDLIQAFEIGNEPNVYPVNGARPATYVFADYLTEYQQWAKSVRSSTSSSFGIMGPAYGCEDAHVRITWVVPAQTAIVSGAMRPSIVSQHYYVNGPGTYPADYLLQSGSTLNMLGDFSAYSASAHLAGSAFRLGEMNSIWNGGIAGISNTFSAALWSIDQMFNLANIGVDGVNWHSSQGTSYQLFQFNLYVSGGMTTYTVAQVNPLYYGLLVFAQMAGRGAKLLPVTTTTTANVSIWATVDNTSTAHLVVINKDEQATGGVRITMPGYTTGTVRFLSAANYSATNGVTFGGQTFDESSDGTLRGELVTTTISTTDGVFTLPNMPITSAALIDFSK
jgi:hypothetical protein